MRGRQLLCMKFGPMQSVPGPARVCSADRASRSHPFPKIPLPGAALLVHCYGGGHGPCLSRSLPSRVNSSLPRVATGNPSLPSKVNLSLPRVARSGTWRASQPSWLQCSLFACCTTQDVRALYDVPNNVWASIHTHAYAHAHGRPSTAFTRMHTRCMGIFSRFLSPPVPLPLQKTRRSCQILKRPLGQKTLFFALCQQLARLA